MTRDPVFTPVFGKLVEARDSGDVADLDPRRLRRDFARHRALLLRGFDLDAEGFCALSERLAGGFLSYQGGSYDRQQVGGSKTLLSVTGGTEMRKLVPFHGEMFYKKIRPEVLWFFCCRAPSRRGETTLCHGAQVYRRLRPATRRLFETHRIRYVREYSATQWRRIFQTDEIADVAAFCADNELVLERRADDAIATVFVCSAIVATADGPAFVNNILPVSAQQRMGMRGSRVELEGGAPIRRRVLRDVWWAARRSTVKIRWQRSDVAMIDNRVLMHGRCTIASPDRDVLVRMSQAPAR